jgi:hypothetical protein
MLVKKSGSSYFSEQLQSLWNQGYSLKSLLIDTEIVGESLTPLPYSPFQLGEIKAKGWLEKQLEIQAKGLAGHLQVILLLHRTFN